jgi:hypothetical protein
MGEVELIEVPSKQEWTDIEYTRRSRGGAVLTKSITKEEVMSSEEAHSIQQALRGGCCNLNRR